MLPPVEQSVLENNPEFVALYSKLTTSLLNPDGSTKNDPAAKERRLVSEVGCLHHMMAGRRELPSTAKHINSLLFH
jgi:hypothetical protein